MNTYIISDLIASGRLLLPLTKGHIKARVKTALVLLNDLLENSNLQKIQVRQNVQSLVNLGDLNEIVTAQKLGFINKNAVSINIDDLPTKYKNEVKFCNSQNSLSNAMSMDQGIYMAWVENNQHNYEWIPRQYIRNNKDLLTKGRGGSHFRKAVINEMRA